jgi:hypothetical protein
MCFLFENVKELESQVKRLKQAKSNNIFVRSNNSEINNNNCIGGTIGEDSSSGVGEISINNNGRQQKVSL